MKLYQFATSHFCEKIRWVLDHKGLPYEVVELGYGSRGHKQLAGRTGQTTVPVLLTDTGRWLRDSTAIALYLEAEHPDPPLLPERAADVTAVRLWEDWADESLAKALYPLYVDEVLTDPALRRRAYEAALGGTPLGRAYPLLQGVFSRRYRSGSGAPQHRIPHLVARVQELMGWVDAHLEGRRYLVGDRFSLADLTVATMLAIVNRPPAAEPHPVVGAPWRAPKLPDDPLTWRVLEWQAAIYAEHRDAGAGS